ncbi:hypothetical protein [Massilia brevitalea]|uniref:hypothetical protein n=1 Tax=Massilia brevitalea TaxID=442526 RepID=UPI002738C55F|nr:hypothetical protein [Massilia brevitalea]
MAVEKGAWAVAIFAARETPAMLMGTVNAAIAACAGRQARIDVLINGNPALAEQFTAVARAIESDTCILRIWSIAAADKAHTWNEYIHRIWDTEGMAFFIDGYARVKPDALDAIARHLAATPTALAASGVPSCGRSAKRLREHMLAKGGIHGNLYAVTAEGMHALRNTGFRMPVGLYRTDPLLGAALTFRLDPVNSRWTRGSVTVVAGATWDVDGIAELSYKNIVAYFKRRLRQAQGELESRAFREHTSLKRLPLHLLPATSQAMVNNWIDANPGEARSLFRKNPSCLYAARQLRIPRNWSATQVPPVLLYTQGFEEKLCRAG